MSALVIFATGSCRVYSLRNMGPKQDLVLDMGAYRYMPLAQPLITDIIENLLDLPNRLYQVTMSLRSFAMHMYEQSTTI